jgi:DNA end-binding protein Ku
MSPEIPAPAAEIHVKRRPIWKGALGFGLVSIPVKLHRAVHEKGVHFHEIHDADGGRIRRRAVCSRDGAPVPREHIVHGFELERGHDVQIARAELDALTPAATRSIDIDAFVRAEEIDPIFHARGYWIVPGAGGARGYALLLAAMAALHKVAVARMVMRSKQVVCVVRPAGDPARALALSVLSYADEIVRPADLDGLPGPEAQPTELELMLAERLVESRTGRFQPERYRDEHREKVIAFARAKAAGEPPAPPAEARPPLQLDLVGALEASLTDAERHDTAA